MPDESVLDTGVLIGVTVEKDTHHRRCVDYVVEKSECHVPPTVDQEFQRKETEIRTTLSEEIIDHRHAVSREVEQAVISEGVIGWIESNLLDPEKNSFRCLKAYYEHKKDQARFRNIDKLEIISDLEELELEVWEDAADSYGGIDELISKCEGPIPGYPDIERKLLICEGDDPVVCIEAHHIAATTDDTQIELATTNPVHFIRQVEGETETRKENILRVTDLADVVDLSWDGSF